MIMSLAEAFRQTLPRTTWRPILTARKEQINSLFFLAHCQLTPYTSQVIRSFRHRGLKELYEEGRSSKVAQRHVQKLLRILTALDRSAGPEGMDIPGFRLHPLKGRKRRHHAVSVSGYH